MAGVNVTIGADSSKAQKELASFQNKTKKIASTIAKGFQERIGQRMFDGLISAARSVPARMKEMIDAGGKLSDQMAKTGASGEGLVVLERALKNNGIAAAQMDDILRKMQDSFSGLNSEQKSTVQAFEMLGLSMSELRALDPVDALKQISVAFRSVGSTADRTAAAMDIFGRSGTALITLFEDQTAFQQAEKELGNLPKLLTDNAQKLDTLSDRFGNLGTAFDAIALTLAIEFMPLIDQITEKIQGIDFVEVSRKVAEVARAVIDLAPKVLAVAAAVKGIQIAKFFAVMVAGLTKSISLWGAETAAVEANTAAKIKNATAGAAAGAGGGAAVAGGATAKGAAGGLMARFPQVLAAAAVGFAGFKVGEFIGKGFANFVPDGPMGFSSDTPSGQVNEQAVKRNAKLDKENAAFRARLQAEQDAAAVRQKQNEEKANKEAEKRKGIIKSIRDEYAHTLKILNARITGDKKLLAQEELRKKIQEEQRASAAEGFILDAKSAEKIVMKKREAEVAEKKRKDNEINLAKSQEEKKANLEGDISETESRFSSAMTRSSITAVSSMQAIGGGGGVAGELNLQKTQTDLQRQLVDLQQKMVGLLEGVKTATGQQPVSQ